MLVNDDDIDIMHCMETQISEVLSKNMVKRGDLKI